MSVLAPVVQMFQKAVDLIEQAQIRENCEPYVSRRSEDIANAHVDFLNQRDASDKYFSLKVVPDHYAEAMGQLDHLERNAKIAEGNSICLRIVEGARHELKLRHALWTVNYKDARARGIESLPVIEPVVADKFMASSF